MKNELTKWRKRPKLIVPGLITGGAALGGALLLAAESVTAALLASVFTTIFVGVTAAIATLTHVWSHKDRERSWRARRAHVEVDPGGTRVTVRRTERGYLIRPTVGIVNSGANAAIDIRVSVMPFTGEEVPFGNGRIVARWLAPGGHRLVDYIDPADGFEGDIPRDPFRWLVRLDWYDEVLGEAESFVEHLASPAVPAEEHYLARGDVHRTAYVVDHGQQEP